MRMRTESEIQKWLQTTIAAGELGNQIDGRSEIQEILKQQESPEFWPDFPIDYLTRLRVLETANEMVGELYDLEPISSSNRSISRTQGESLFVDLLYARPEGSKFVALEVKKDKATAREAITELFAYEHEIQNHIPFASSRDILLVIVAREFPPLLDHAVCGLITWGRRRILCLRFTDTGGVPRLSIHTPSSWAAVGQTILPSNGLQIAHLSVRLNEKLSSDETRAIFDTASQLMAREAERAGGSGFVFVADHSFFPGLSQSEYVLIAGALNPYCFLPQAEGFRFAAESDSPISAYLLDDSRREDMTISWDWIGIDGDAAATYLRQFGDASWENFSSWKSFRDSYRWRTKSVTAHRYLFPITAESWGVLGDYMRDVVKHWARLENFSPGYCKPGIDWRYPWLAVQLLDDLALPPVVEAGQWTFGALFEFGMRLGRHTAYAAQFADADESQRRKIRPSLFWAEADILRVVEEVRIRYLAAQHLRVKPPIYRVGLYKNSTQVRHQTITFAKWVAEEFIGPKEPLLLSAFTTGLESCALFDSLSADDGEAFLAVQASAASRAREWLTLTVEAVFDGQMSPSSLKDLHAVAASAFGGRLLLNETKATAINALAALSDIVLVENLPEAIPQIVDCWCAQLGHVLTPITVALPDWDWFEQQIREHRRRGVENPCIVVSAGGQFGVGAIPKGMMQVPQLTDPKTQVLVLLNQSLVRFALRVTWAELRAGKIPGASQ